MTIEINLKKEILPGGKTLAFREEIKL